MIKEFNFDLNINNKDEVEIIVNKKVVKKITKTNKNINTNEIYKMLKYEKTNTYKFLPVSKYTDTSGEANESKRLFNYTYDLFSEILDAVEKKNKKYIK